MASVIVNARVDADDKRDADRVLAANRRTWSQAIQALAAYMRRTNSYPEALIDPDGRLDQERERRMGVLSGASGIAKSNGFSHDDAAARLERDGWVKRYG